MIIEIEGQQYVIEVKESFMDEHKQIKEDIISIEEWAEIVRKKAISSLFYLEEAIESFVGYPIRLSDDYPELKKPILNFSGSVSRLPKNLIIRKID